MSWFRRSRWEIEGAPKPWGARPSIFRHLEAARLSAGGQPPDLPDETAASEGRVRWAAGAWDGVASHHMGASEDTEAVDALWTALGAVVRKAGEPELSRFYGLVTQMKVVGCADALVRKSREDAAIDRGCLRRLATWLVLEGADREPVKLGIVLLGVVGDEEARDVLVRLAGHDEFTLFSIVALGNLGLLDEIGLWEIARELRGWGRIHAVERLAGAQDPRVRRWLVREGWRNSIEDAYLALVCAEGGDLAGELAEARIDPELLSGASGILGALAQTTSGGGPTAGFEAYGDGVAAVRRYLVHAAAAGGDFFDVLVTSDLLRAVAETTSGDSSELLARGWTPEVRAEIAGLARRATERGKWEERILAVLDAPDAAEFERASQAATVLGLDVFEAQFQRLWRATDAASESWWYVTRTADPRRMARVVALAEERLPLDELATGPANEHGVGVAWKQHLTLGHVLQELRRFPGDGWTLLRAGLRSPVTWTRNMAIAALAAWDRAEWPEDLPAILERAAAEEPVAATRYNLARLMKGDPLS